DQTIAIGLPDRLRRRGVAADRFTGDRFADQQSGFLEGLAQGGAGKGEGWAPAAAARKFGDHIGRQRLKETRSSVVGGIDPAARRYVDVGQKTGFAVPTAEQNLGLAAALAN